MLCGTSSSVCCFVPVSSSLQSAARTGPPTSPSLTAPRLPAGRAVPQPSSRREVIAPFCCQHPLQIVTFHKQCDWMKHFFQSFSPFLFIYCDGLLFDCREGMGLLPLATKTIAFLSADKAARHNASFPAQSCVNSPHALPGHTVLFSWKSKSQFCYSVCPRCHFRNNSCFKALASALFFAFRT